MSVGTATASDVIFWKKAYCREHDIRQLVATSPPNVWPQREAKLGGRGQLEHYYARGLPHERNNDSGAVAQCMLPDPTAPLWPPAGQAPVASARWRSQPAATASGTRAGAPAGSLALAGATALATGTQDGAGCTPASSARTRHRAR
mmetsp:Transcript_109326/g.352929  ORF Transcript_109326/g.352929 Transcript_109326/m.352929 type:complete len:146 (-) Transcript_109326:88-525(-)